MHVSIYLPVPVLLVQLYGCLQPYIPVPGLQLYIRRIYSTGTGTIQSLYDGYTLPVPVLQLYIRRMHVCIYQPVLVQLYGSSWADSTCTAGVVDSVRECGCIQVDSVSLSNRRTERRRSDSSPATRELPAPTQSSMRVVRAVLAVSCGTAYCGTVRSIPV
jgi:hypothetical protein